MDKKKAFVQYFECLSHYVLLIYKDEIRYYRMIQYVLIML